MAADGRRQGRGGGWWLLQWWCLVNCPQAFTLPLESEVSANTKTSFQDKILRLACFCFCPLKKASRHKRLTSTTLLFRAEPPEGGEVHPALSLSSTTGKGPKTREEAIWIFQTLQSCHLIHLGTRLCPNYKLGINKYMLFKTSFRWWLYYKAIAEWNEWIQKRKSHGLLM